MMGRGIEAVLFDKDGTLFDFAATWNTFAARLIDQLSEGDDLRRHGLARALKFDLESGRFLPDSPVIAGTNREVALLIAPILPRRTVDELEALIMAEAEVAPLSEAVALVPYLAGLAARGLTLGVMTNDSESVARAHLRAAGIEGMFDFVAGADSGHGAKPSPLPLLAFATATGHAPERVVMVGDSLHDLVAGRAAGMWTAGVLTGMAGADALAPMADVILPDIGHLPGWLAEVVT
ncbi:phosphoglycolate phosphatase [Antarctobacter heliothermus]|uniref:phosphoglycolate phosphatase n=1 Tax=Antarctobacter heliothermus TaxID=74033 RepID=A0A222EAC0_9RHOB|nr:phosphoglycolate phosphatase [Antarctobacter heliothermus]|tara:strand:- start:12768 stop:13475 length:708 start_codon:yes stop_codon:yes gene_type:complete